MGLEFRSTQMTQRPLTPASVSCVCCNDRAQVNSMSPHALLNRIKSIARGSGRHSMEKMLAFYHALEFIQLDALAGDTHYPSHSPPIAATLTVRLACCAELLCSSSGCEGHVRGDARGGCGGGSGARGLNKLGARPAVHVLERSHSSFCVCPLCTSHYSIFGPLRDHLPRPSG